jgi:hypothetical protein
MVLVLERWKTMSSPNAAEDLIMGIEGRSSLLFSCSISISGDEEMEGEREE